MDGIRRRAARSLLGNRSSSSTRTTYTYPGLQPVLTPPTPSAEQVTRKQTPPPCPSGMSTLQITNTTDFLTSLVVAPVQRISETAVPSGSVPNARIIHVQTPTQTPPAHKYNPHQQSTTRTLIHRHILHEIRAVDQAIIDHVETFLLSDVLLKLSVLDLKTRITERDNIPKGDHAANSDLAKKLDELIQRAREDIIEYVKHNIGNADYEWAGFELRLKVLDLDTRIAE